MRAISVALVFAGPALAIGACSSTERSATGPAGGATSIGGAGGSGGSATANPGGAGGVDFAGGGITCETLPPSLDARPNECCGPDALRPLPDKAFGVIDLSAVEPDSDGTCSGNIDGREAVLLPHATERYPLKVILPRAEGRDPGCEQLCTPEVAEFGPTTFGVGLSTRDPESGEILIGGNTGRLLAISVPPPWYFVSGGCGEACPWPCLESYQEFGIHSCLSIAHGDFGFATADPQAPSVEAVIELIDAPGNVFEFASDQCCLFSSQASQ